MARGRQAAAVAAGPIEGPWALPEGWRWAAAGDVFPLSYGKALPAKVRNVEGAVPVYGSSGAVGNHTEALIDGPAVIVGRKGSAGSVHFCTGPSWPIDTAYFAQETDELDVRFGFHLLSSLGLNQMDQSTAIPSLSRDTYNPLLIPVPPLDTQRRIVARIDELFAELDDGEAALGRARADLENYRKSLLKAAVTGELTADWRADNPAQETGEKLLQRILTHRKARWEAKPKNRGKRYKDAKNVDLLARPDLPHGWTWASVEQIGEVVTGATPKTERSEFYGGNVPFFTPADLDQGYFTMGSKRTISAQGLASVREIPAGSVMVTCIGATIGKTGVNHVAGATNQQINSIVPTQSAYADYIYLYFAGLGQREVIDRSSSTTLPILNKGDFSQIPVPLPPLPEAREASILTKRMLAEAEDLESNMRGSAMSKHLRQSILSAAFRGDVVQ